MIKPATFCARLWLSGVKHISNYGVPAVIWVRLRGRVVRSGATLIATTIPDLHFCGPGLRLKLSINLIASPIGTRTRVHWYLFEGL